MMGPKSNSVGTFLRGGDGLGRGAAGGGVGGIGSRMRQQQQQQQQQSAREGQIVRYYCSFTNTIGDVLASRGWREVGEDGDWDFVWSDREWVYATFDKVHLEQWQRLNHFRNGRELCRKDLMAKNLKRRRLGYN